MADLAPLQEALRTVGTDPSQVLTPDAAHLVAYGHEVVSVNSVPGVVVLATRERDGIHASVTVVEGAQVARPVHLCFGMFAAEGVQNVRLELVMERGSRATLWSHCLFTQAERARHAMNAAVDIRAGAELVYNEAHFHGPSGGIEVLPVATVKVGRRARYLADFSLVQGRVGKLAIDYDVAVAEDGLAELTSRIYGRGEDRIGIREVLNLNGARSRGLIKSRVAVSDDASAEVAGATFGNAAGARGHVDCLEIVRGRAKASAIPEVRITHPEAKVTHEAAIGSVDERQLETLMARGLAPEQAVDLIILGMLR
jgi:Fe-S cluster assembly scaffold protein SufB